MYSVCVQLSVTVLISPRTANVFHPFAVCREHIESSKYKGLAKLALKNINHVCEHEQEVARKVPEGENSLLLALFKPSQKVRRRIDLRHLQQGGSLGRSSSVSRCRSSHAHVRVRIRMHTHAHACAHACTHTHLRMHMYAYVCTRARTRMVM
jgi:hypothetical protein